MLAGVNLTVRLFLCVSLGFLALSFSATIRTWATSKEERASSGSARSSDVHLSTSHSFFRIAEKKSFTCRVVPPEAAFWGGSDESTALDNRSTHGMYYLPP